MQPCLVLRAVCIKAAVFLNVTPSSSGKICCFYVQHLCTPGRYAIESSRIPADSLRSASTQSTFGLPFTQPAIYRKKKNTFCQEFPTLRLSYYRWNFQTAVITVAKRNKYRGGAFFEKLTIAQLALHKNRRFITVLTTAHDLSPWSQLNAVAPSHYIRKINFNIIL